MENVSKYHGHTLNIKNVMEKIMDIKFLEGILIMALGVAGTFLLPIASFVLGSFVLVAIDHFTGLKSAKKAGEKITSEKMRRSIDKGLVYMLFIIAAHVIDIFFLRFPVSPISYIAALAVARVEFFSIDENVNKLTGVSIWKNIKYLFEHSKSSKK